MTTKRAIMTLIGVSLLVAAALAAPADTKLGRCLPKSGDVSGWQAVSSSYKYGSGNGIADIYNGGYEKLLQKGMKAACTQNYSNDSRRINVYGNEFDTAANAKAYYNSETSGSGWSAVSGASEGAKYKKTSSVVVGHVYRGKVHAKVVAQGTSDAQVAAVQAFLRKLSEKIGKEY
ncbi:MAG: hypothetical protein GX134_04685 [candidate division WS1 bacterium]|jgi:hypothetical protein|nr:hypothetical protein [candidate division WS1 bacterium]